MRIVEASVEFEQELKRFSGDKQKSLSIQISILKKLFFKYKEIFHNVSGWKTKLYLETILKNQKVKAKLINALAMLYKLQSVNNFKDFSQINETCKFSQNILDYMNRNKVYKFSDIKTSNQMIDLVKRVYGVYELGDGDERASNADHLKWAIDSPLLETLPGEALERTGQILIEPDIENEWESKNVYNAGVIKNGGTIYIIYRGENDKRISRLGMLLIDEDRQRVRLKYPILYENNEKRDLIVSHEDPRLQVVDSDFGRRVCLSYCECINGKSREVLVWCNLDEFVNLARKSVKYFLKDDWSRLWKKEGNGYIFPDINDRGAVLFPYMINGKYVILHRIHKYPGRTDGLYLTYTDKISPPFSRNNDKLILAPSEPVKWDDARKGKVGTGSQPIMTEYGWLIFYHAHRVDEISDIRKYALGVMLTDLNYPNKLLYRSPNPVLLPLEEYERKGYVPNVVFTCGAILIDKGTVLVYYAGGDRVICEAKTKIADLIPAQLRK